MAKKKSLEKIIDDALGIRPRSAKIEALGPKAVELTEQYGDNIAWRLSRLAKGKHLRKPYEYVDLFWKQFNPEKCDLCNKGRKRGDKFKPCQGLCSNYSHKKALLVALAGIVFNKRPYDKRQSTRKDFDEVKEDKYSMIREICFLCGEQAHHRHHIIQIQHGGQNHRGNIVALCRKCHRSVHKSS